MTISEVLAAAVRHHRAGELAKAEQLYRQILQIDPRHADGLALLGVVAHQTGHHAAAVELIGQAIALAPSIPSYYNNLGLAQRAMGNLAEAATCFQQAVQLRPDYGEAIYNLGLVRKDEGNRDGAIALYREAIRLQPTFADAYNNLGVVLKEAAHQEAAIACYRRALELRPNYAEAYYNLGGALREAGKSDDAAAAYRRALQIRPDYAPAYCNLGMVLAQQGKLAEAVAQYEHAVRLQPDLVEAHVNLAAVFSRQGKFPEAVACCRRAIQLQPGLAETYCCLANALRYLGQLAEAVDCFRKDLELRPERAETYNLLGNAYKEQGRLDEALEAYQRAMQLQPDLRDAHTNFLLASHYRPSLAAAELAALHVEWDDRHGSALRGTWQPHGNSRHAERPLRLGFVSTDLGFHPVGYFLIRTFENLDRQAYTVTCYSDRNVVNPLSGRFRAAAANWQDTSERSDEAIADQIRRDEIDILFELSGHTYGNRLLVFARKPAPIQISWIGYEGTTGLRAIDYLLADYHLIPPGAEGDYPERVLRLPDSYVCYEPPSEAPEVSPLPAYGRSYVTFASFNNPAKITAEVVDVWAAILRQVPRARLLLKYLGMDDDGARGRLVNLFSAREVAADRLVFQGWSSFADYLAEFREVDVALDPFPFSGGVTTCNALWMGVPVITCPGKTFASRHGLSYLSSMGMTETIAGDLHEYVRLATELATDLDRLAALRAGLRPQMAGSPLCDGPRHAASLLQMLRHVWRDYCAHGIERTG